MEKTWYIKIKGKQQGPYTFEQLKHNRQITPDTLVWNPQLSRWVPLRDIPELQEIFKDPEEPRDKFDESIENPSKFSSALALEMQRDPPQWIWILLAIALILLILIQLFKDK